MARATGFFRKLRAADGRIKIAGAVGVLALAAVLALFGVLPAMAALVTPSIVTYGGGSGACSATIEGHLPSAARNEFHINNPMPGQTYYDTGDSTTYNVKVTVRTEDAGSVFSFTVNPDTNYVVYDVIVNGGSQNNLYDYDLEGLNNVKQDGQADFNNGEGLHAPIQKLKPVVKYFNLSHINICWDVPGLSFFECDTPQTLTSEGLITSVTTEIFANSIWDCNGKRAIYLLDSVTNTVTLDFEGDGSATIAGRMDFTKQFSTPPPWPDLQYDRDDAGSVPFQDMQWCYVRNTASAAEEAQFGDDVLNSGKYPSLVSASNVPLKDTDDGNATACKVFESENATGLQKTVVYFEFQDPQFR